MFVLKPSSAFIFLIVSAGTSLVSIPLYLLRTATGNSDLLSRYRRFVCRRLPAEHICCIGGVESAAQFHGGYFF